MRVKNNLETLGDSGGDQDGKDKGSGQLSHEPVHRDVQASLLCFATVVAGRRQTFQELDLCGRPFLGVSFRAFTADPNAEKGTPTAQLFDNRSIA
ncbi:MAG TPA: hypothetical protein VL128_15000 [Candidatus Eisenbacteria bacterium]|nr:hypothetical protein [Candidatus Eisenbacteria bacterium]